MYNSSQTPPSSPPSDEWRELAEALREATGLDLSHYRPAQSAKRLEHVASHRGQTLSELSRACRADVHAASRLVHDLLIQTTQFFRDPEHWSWLQEHLLPSFIGERGRLRMWSAACSNGAEPYSLAALVHAVSGREHEVLATDVDPIVLDVARRGAYTRAQGRSIPVHLAREHFETEDGGLRVRDHLARQVAFRKHDLLGPAPAGQFDLILCRNVTIYFDDSARDALFRRLRAALKPGGYLFLGATERIFSTREVGLAQVAPCFYVRTD